MKTNFKKVFLKIAIISAFLAIFLAPTIALAEIKLELNYPNLPGISDLTQSTQSLPMALRYYVQLGVIIAILVCIVSLVWAGVSYISSSGQPGAMKQARERIFNTFIGLAILIGSFVILKTLSPQIALLGITKTSIASESVLLFSYRGYTEFNGTNFGDLRESGDIYILTGDIKDTTSPDFFGPLTDKTAPNTLNDTKINFKNFDFYAIGFWGENASDYRVTIFSDRNFKDIDKSGHGANNARVEKIVYEAIGKIDPATNQPFEDTSPKYIAPKAFPNQNITVFPVHANDSSYIGSGKEGFAFSLFPYVNDQGGGNITNGSTLPFPPLSIQLESIGIGGELVATENGATTSLFLPEGTFSPELPDDINLTKIKINSKTRNKEADLITVLFDKKYAQGSVSIYFQYPSSEFVNWYPKLYKSEYYAKQSGTLNVYEAVKDNNFVVSSETEQVDSAMGGSEKVLYKAKFVGLPRVTDPNLPKEYTALQEGFGSPPSLSLEPENVNRIAQGPLQPREVYGSLRNEPVKSYLQVELSKNAEKCKSVTLCRQKNLSGGCLKFVSNNQMINPAENVSPPGNESINITLPMPLYQPVNLPEKITTQVKRQTPDPTTGKYVGEPWYGKVDGANGFSDIINSIKIDGPCLVILFERKLNWFDSISKKFGGWGGVGDVARLTGERSIAIFNGSNNLQGNFNLPDQVLGCSAVGNIFSFFSRGGSSGCASSIVIFPIEDVKTTKLQ